MNWVGGTRNRIKLKQEKKQQKAFFEKRKLKSKIKLSDPTLSPQRNSSVSWDLLTLHVVDRIASNKEQTGMSKKTLQVDMKDTKMPMGRHNIELPMSPCAVPSQIFLEESQCSAREQGWNNREKQFTNTGNLKYRKLSPVIESSPLEYNMKDDSCSSKDRFSVYRFSDAWSPAKYYPVQQNPRPGMSFAWDLSSNNKELQSAILVPTELALLNEPSSTHAYQEEIVSKSRNLTEYSKDRLLQNSLMNNASLQNRCDNLNNCIEKDPITFPDEDMFPMTKKATTQISTMNQNMNFFGREFPLTQCFNPEMTQPLTTYIGQEKSMCGRTGPAENHFAMETPCKTRDTYDTSFINTKSDVPLRKNGVIFTQTDNNFFNDSIQKHHFSENNLRDQQLLENDFEEFNIQENNCFFSGFEETCNSWENKCTGVACEEHQKKSNTGNVKQLNLDTLKCGRKETSCAPSQKLTFPEVSASKKERNTSDEIFITKKLLDNSFGSSQSTSCSPEETESCCSTVSDMSELLDDKNMQLDSSITRNGCVQENVCDIKRMKKELKIQTFQENARNTVSKHQSYHSDMENVSLHQVKIKSFVNNRQNETQDQFVPSSFVSYTPHTCASDKTTVYHKLSCVQDECTQTESSLISSEKSDVAIQCNLINATEILSFSGKKLPQLKDDGNLIHTTREQCIPSHGSSRGLENCTKKHKLLIETDFLSFDDRKCIEKLDDIKCVIKNAEGCEVRNEGNTKPAVRYSNSVLIHVSCRNREIQRSESTQLMRVLPNESKIYTSSGIQNMINQQDFAACDGNVIHVSATETASIESNHRFGWKINSAQESTRQINVTDMKFGTAKNSEENKTLHEIADILLLLGHSQ